MTPPGSATVKVGLSLGDDLSLEHQSSLARDVEAAGLQSMWVPDALARDPFLVCQTWAGATSRVNLGVGVAQVLTRSPAQLAKSAATLQEASGERFILGIGASRAAAMAWHGADYARPVAALEDAIAILRAVLSGDMTDHDGRILRSHGFQLKAVPLPRPVPLFLGAGGPRSLALAGRLADGVLLSWKSPDGVMAAAKIVRDAAEEAGRPAPEVAGYVRLVVAEDRDQARAALARQVAYYWQFHAPDFALQLPPDAFRRADEAFQTGGAEELERRIEDDILQAFGWYGTPEDDVTSTLAQYRDAGLEHVVLRVVPVGDAVASVRAAIDLVSTAVA